MSQVFPTKANLLNTKKTLELARLGYDLMDRKRNILVREMMQMIDDAKDIQNEIADVYEKAYDALKKATFTLGDLERLACLIPEENSLQISSRSVMGVELPTVSVEESPAYVAAFGLDGTNGKFDEAYLLFSRVKTLTAELARIENSVCRLADAIKKTQKRSNALSNIMIPRLQETVRYITEVLDEKEREDFSRLKVTKSFNESKKTQG